MSDLADHLEDYLTLRRTLGFKLAFHGRVLPQFVAYLEATGATTVTMEAAIIWAGLPEDVQPISRSHRLGAVRGFARYLATIDPATQVPPTGIWPTTATRPTPHLWTDTQIAALLDAARGLHPSLRAATYVTLFGLLAASGMRIGEALGLRRDDVDLAEGVITIRDAKFGRTRQVPLHPTTTKALRCYAQDRDRRYPTPGPATFFVSRTGAPLLYRAVHHTFVTLTTTMGLRTATSRPRIHDLRHAFAVRTLIGWHRDGLDVQARMPLLSDYMGHVNPAGTFWYLSAAPELMELATARLQQHYGAQP